MNRQSGILVIVHLVSCVAESSQTQHHSSRSDGQPIETSQLDTDIDERLPLETYLEVVEMKKIVENKENWPQLKSVFNIPEPNEKGLAKNLKWMLRVNELRRIPAHPARERKYKVEDFDYIDFINNEFIKRTKLGRSETAINSTDNEEDDD